MRKILIFVFIFCGSSLCFGQQTFLFVKKSLIELRSYEDSIKSKPLGFIKTNVAEGYFPTAKEKKDYYPLCFIRTNDSFFPELHVQYFYNENDSSLLSTSYDWNIMDYVKNLKTDGDKFDIEIKREKDYLTKYSSIKTELIKIWGQPNSVEENKANDGYFYRLKWDNDKTNILVLLKFSTELKQFPGNMKFGSYNIRVKIDYKK
jgi:hypothetical protein